jgi:hypothetical protein
VRYDIKVLETGWRTVVELVGVRLELVSVVGQSFVFDALLVD